MKKYIIITILILSVSVPFLYGETQLGKMTTGMTKAELCDPNFRTSSVRPPTGYTNRIKFDMMDKIGATNPSDFQLDHIVPLCLGGEPTEPNLQLQPIAEARVKDRVEKYLCVEVCDNKISLKSAQRKIRNWQDVMVDKLGGLDMDDD